MNKVFPRKWTGLIDRAMWAAGPWDREPEDRIQWGDKATGLPCLMIRAPTGAWNGYVGIGPEHPGYGLEIDGLPAHRGIVYHSFTNDVHYIEPEPWGDLPIDENHPETLIDIIRLRPMLWFFGFDAAHGRDIVPGLDAMMARHASQAFINDQALSAYDRGSAYRDTAYIKKCCADLAAALDPKKWKRK